MRHGRLSQMLDFRPTVSYLAADLTELSIRVLTDSSRVVFAYNQADSVSFWAQLDTSAFCNLCP